MFLLYNLIGFFILLSSPVIIIYRILKNKESPSRFKEKFCFFTKKRKRGKLIWFHGSSVGEIMSVIPIIKQLEKNKAINQILVTSSTLSSSVVFSKYRFKKTIHQFFPLDISFLTNIFLEYWKPQLTIFIESEIWPNMIKNINNKSIPLILLNARLTKKSFDKWIKNKKISNYLFSKIDLALPQNIETHKYLKKLKVKRIKFLGNLKYTEEEDFTLLKLNKLLKKELSKKLILCGASTHHNEENNLGKVHLKLKKRYKNILTIIIPRHVHRSFTILRNLEKMNLNVHRHSSNKRINEKTDIYLVDTYGEAKKFFQICKIVFLGGSLVRHGGQNPIEAARYGCKIIHGPHINNFKDVYSFLGKKNISTKVNNLNNLTKSIEGSLIKKPSNNQVKMIQAISNEILDKNLREINNFINA